MIKPQRTTLGSCSNSQQSHNPHRSFTENLQKNTDFKAELISMWQLKSVYTVHFVLSTNGNIPHKLHGRLQLLSVHSCAVYSSAEHSNTECMPYSWKFLAEQCIRSAWAVRLYCFENRLNCCEVRKVNDDDDNNNYYYYYYYYSIPIYYRANLTEQQSIIKPIQHNQKQKLHNNFTGKHWPVYQWPKTVRTTRQSGLSDSRLPGSGLPESGLPKDHCHRRFEES